VASENATDLKTLRAVIKTELRKPQVRPVTERRVYNLPREMVARVLHFQLEQRLPSETEAARVLLDQGLAAWEAGRANGK
jgi:hypothetical protein